MPSFLHIDEVQSAIAKGRLKIAFKKLKDLFPLLEAHKMADDNCKHLQKRFLLLSGEFHFNDEKELLKISEEAFTEVNRNRITSALIEMTTEIGELINKQEISANGNGQTDTPSVSPQKKGVIEITLHDRDLASFSAEEREHFFNAIAELVKMEKEGIVIKSIKSGSVKITIELNEDKAKELELLIEEGGLGKWGTVSVKRVKPYEVDPKVLAVLKKRGIGFEVEDGRLFFGVGWRKADLSGVDLSGADLSGADLNRAFLSRAFLSRVKLNKAFLNRAFLNRANLSGANLIKAQLGGANLKEANLSSANLIGANLSSANLIGANLSSANLIGANLGGANLSGAKLNGADLREAKLNSADLGEGYWSGTYWGGADLSGTDLSGADLSGADLSGADLSGAIFHTSQKQYLEETGIDTKVVKFIDDDRFRVDKEVEIDV